MFNWVFALVIFIGFKDLVGRKLGFAYKFDSVSYYAVVAIKAAVISVGVPFVSGTNDAFFL